MGIGMFEEMAAAGRGGLGGLGALNIYPEVRAVQGHINAAHAQFVAAGLPAPATLTVDGVYGGRTHRALAGLVDAYVRTGWCAATSSGEVTRNGPWAAVNCFAAIGQGRPGSPWQGGVVEVLQQAWREWRAAPPAAHPDPADAPTPQESQPESPPGGAGAGAGADAGMSTGTKILIGAGVLGALALLAWAIWGD